MNDKPLKATARSFPAGFLNLVPWSDGQAIPFIVRFIFLFMATTVPSFFSCDTHFSSNVSVSISNYV